MVETMRKVLEAVLERLYKYVTIYLPSLLAALILFLAAVVTAVLARWLLYRIFKGPTIDRFLRRSGVAFMLDPSGRLRATRLVAEGCPSPAAKGIAPQTPAITSAPSSSIPGWP